MLSTSMLQFSYFVGLEKICVKIAELLAIGVSVKKQAFPALDDSVISLSKKKCVSMSPRCLQLDFHFKSKHFPCVRLQTTIFCADLVYLSAKKNAQSCTHGDLKKLRAIVFSVKYSGFCVPGHAE